MLGLRVSVSGYINSPDYTVHGIVALFEIAGQWLITLGFQSFCLSL